MTVYHRAAFHLRKGPTMTNASKKSLKKTVAGVAVLVAVAGLSYAAGAAKGKAPITTAAPDIVWEPYAPNVPLQVAKLWGDRAKGGDYGMLLKMPGGFEAGMHSHTLDYYAVAVQGTWVHTVEGDASPPKDLTAGSYVFQPGKQFHNDVCKSKTECVLFIHQHGKGDFIPPKAPKAAAAPAGAAPAAAAPAPAAPAPVAPAPVAPAPPAAPAPKK
jgi:hypothetical protein